MISDFITTTKDIDEARSSEIMLTVAVHPQMCISKS